MVVNACLIYPVCCIAHVPLSKALDYYLKRILAHLHLFVCWCTATGVFFEVDGGDKNNDNNNLYSSVILK